MKKTKIFYSVISALCLLGLMATACAPAATPAPTSAPAATTAPAAPAATATVAPTATAAPVTLTYLVDNSQNTVATTTALVNAYMKLHPNVTITIEQRPQGGDGDNVVKTRLATGTMDDLFYYNSGSLLQALNPSTTLVDISKEPYMANVVDSFLPTVSQNGEVFGVPTGTALGGGILYNKKVFAQLGLSVPKTWADFEANNDKIKAAGITPVVATYGPNSTWTSQLFVLADFYNVVQADPTFAADYTANKAKYATTPAAMAGFNYLAEGYQKGWYEKDFTTTELEPGLKLLADGKAAQYPQLSFVLATIAADSPTEVNDIGFFAQPGTDASKNGATIWMPAGTYIPKTSKNIAAAEDFQAFIASSAGVDAINAQVPPQGPYLIKGTTLPATVLPAVNDINAYIQSGNSEPALEFLSPVKGPSLEQICIAAGTGQMTGAQAAAAYDQDVEKEAKQLNLPGW